MAEGMLRALMAERGIDAEITSAGRISNGVPASGHAVEVMRRRGVDLSEHRSRTLDRAQLDAADLVLCMERDHVREAVLLDVAGFPRIFTVKELARRARLVGARGEHETVERWLRRAGLGRRPQDHLGASDDDDVADPMGRSYDAYEDTADELDASLRTIVDAMWPADARRPASQPA
jgi:protein-tyrosine phosphatase